MSKYIHLNNAKQVYQNFEVPQAFTHNGNFVYKIIMYSVNADGDAIYELECTFSESAGVYDIKTSKDLGGKIQMLDASDAIKMLRNCADIIINEFYADVTLEIEYF